ncbi:MAG: hypothetical protein AAGC60_11660 [Acidobacteriota bacterium]
MPERSRPRVSPTRFRLLFVAPTMLMLVVLVAPLIGGGETLYFRDVLSSHWPLKAAQGQLLAEGSMLPLVDPYRAGQPLLGNPNALVLYPTSLLLLVADPLWVLNAHIWLHVLLAPWAAFWLGRAWGLGRPAAWAVGVAYGGGGFLLSTANLFNMVAGAALTPAFVAACLGAARTQTPRQRTAAWSLAALLWALLLLAGDPTLAAAAFALGATAVVARALGSRDRGTDGERAPGSLRETLYGLALATVGGLLVAAPLIVETLRILPRSRRGYWRFDPESILTQSWHPATLLEQLTPLLFGGPLAGAWGTALHGGHEPLILSLHLGWAVLALVVVSVGHGGLAARWAWGWTALGLCFALGAHNPLVPPLLELPGASLLRYPIRLWSLPALALALLAGIGLERLLRGAPGALVRLRAVLGAGFALIALALVGLVLPGAPSARTPAWLLRPWLPTIDDELSGSLLAAEAYRWSVTWLLLALGLAALLATSLLWRRRPLVAAALLLALHFGSQLVLLGPLLDHDDAAPYRQPPGLLSALPAGPLIAHDDALGVFGTRQRPTLDPEDRDLGAVTRVRLERAPHSLGIAHGRRYAFAATPEGLDSFFTSALADALAVAPDDAGRLQMLRGSGVDLLVTSRPFDEPLLEEPSLGDQGLELVDSVQPNEPRAAVYGASPSWIYRLGGSPPPYVLARRVVPAPTMNEGVLRLAAPSFDPRSEVVLSAADARAVDGTVPGDSQSGSGDGEVLVRHETPERVELEVTSPGGGVLVASERAWLALWRARVDDTEADVLVANMHRIGVAVPAGTHRVTLWVDRRPTRVAVTASLLALATLLALAVRGRAPRRMRDST